MKGRIEEANKTLEREIAERQAFEQEHPIHPYSTYKTTLDFVDSKGITLLGYAAILGDLEKVKELLSKGASINVGYAPFQLALEFNQLEVAKYLYEQGATCFDIQSAEFEDGETKKWFLSMLGKSLDEVILQNPTLLKENCGFPSIPEGNHFFNTIQLLSEPRILLLCRMIELGDVENIKALESYFKPTDLLFAAIKYKNIGLVMYLIDRGAQLNTGKPYVTTALHAALEVGADDIAELLVQHGANVNAQDSNKYNALLLAIAMNNERMVKLLCDNGADIACRNVDGENVYHLAAKKGGVEIIKYLKAKESFKGLTDAKNIYGKTPLDLAIQNKNDDVIAVLSPGIDMEKVRLDGSYGKPDVAINQNKIIDNFRYYLVTQYRSSEFLSGVGYCNAFSYLHLLYSAMGREDYYFDTLRLLSSWDKKPSSLSEPISTDMPQAKYYRYLGDVFEQWINDLTVFQATSAPLGPSQEERNKQHRMVAGHSEYEPTTIFAESGINLRCERSTEKISELIKFLSKMPSGIVMNIGGARHATSAYVGSNNTMISYDPNMPFRVDSGRSADDLVSRIIDYKYIAIGEYASNMHLQISIFYFKKDKDRIDFENFKLFGDDELPKDNQEAQKFQQQSPNKFSHLHLAVMTHSLPVIRQLLKTNVCDINAHDVVGRTALDMASHPDFLQEDIIDLFIANGPNNTDFEYLFFNAIKSNNFRIVERLLEQKKVDVNKANTSTGVSPLVAAIDGGNETLINLLIRYGANPITALGAVIVHKPQFYQLVISALGDINKKDSAGNTAIHYLRLRPNIEILRDLLVRKIDVNIVGADDVLPIDYINSWRCNLNNNEKYQYSEILMPYLPDKKLADLLINYAKNNDTKSEEAISFSVTLFGLCKDRKAILEMRDNQGYTALQHAFMIKDLDKFERLLKAGCDVDVAFPNNKNNFLITLIKMDFFEEVEKYKMIHLLLDHKIDINSVNSAGETALSLVRESKDEKLKEIFLARGLLAKAANDTPSNPLI